MGANRRHYDLYCDFHTVVPETVVTMNISTVHPRSKFRQRPPSSEIPGSQPNLNLDTYHTTRSSARAVDAVRNNLRKALEHDPNFFSKFFPIDSRIRRTYEEFQNEFRYRNRWS